MLVWGGAGSVGQFVIQLAKKFGLFVVAVAGVSTDVAKAAGADVVLSYKADNFEDELLAVVQEHNIHRAFDAVSQPATTRLAAHALAAGSPAPCFLTTLLPLKSTDRLALPTSIQFTQTNGPDVHKQECDAAREVAGRFAAVVGGWLASGAVRAPRVRVVPGGLAGVGEGLRELREGKVKGQKLVYRISETPGLN